MLPIRGLVAEAGRLLITTGMFLEDLVKTPPVDEHTDSCLRCRGKIAVAPPELDAMLLRERDRGPLDGLPPQDRLRVAEG